MGLRRYLYEETAFPALRRSFNIGILRDGRRGNIIIFIVWQKTINVIAWCIYLSIVREMNQADPDAVPVEASASSSPERRGRPSVCLSGFIELSETCRDSKGHSATAS